MRPDDTRSRARTGELPTFHVGRIRRKLAALLAAEGIEIHPLRLNATQLWEFSSHKRRGQECETWNGEGIDQATGREVHLVGWEPMTTCVKHGIRLEDQDKYGVTIVWSKIANGATDAA